MLTTIHQDIDELIYSRLTKKQKDKWDSIGGFYEDLLPKITKAKWAINALAEIDRRCELRTEARYREMYRRNNEIKNFLKDNRLSDWELDGHKAYKVVDRELEPGKLHSYFFELREGTIFVTSTDGWRIDIIGNKTLSELKQL